MPRKPLNPNETKQERFKRIAEPRANEMLRRLRVLGNCANNQIYSYTPQQIEKIFTAISEEVEKTKSLFTRGTPPPKVEL